MHQTFYIDPDEEVTSLIGRMKEVSSDTLVFVVPERALILGSLINLKLLKREAKRLEKELIVVTQDKQGLETAKRAGIETRVSVKDLPVELHQEEIASQGAVNVPTAAPVTSRQSVPRQEGLQAAPPTGVPAPESVPNTVSMNAESGGVSRQGMARSVDMRAARRGAGPNSSVLHASAQAAATLPRQSQAMGRGQMQARAQKPSEDQGSTKRVSIYEDLPSIHMDTSGGPVPSASSLSDAGQEKIAQSPSSDNVSRRGEKKSIGSSSWGDILEQKTDRHPPRTASAHPVARPPVSSAASIASDTVSPMQQSAKEVSARPRLDTETMREIAKADPSKAQGRTKSGGDHKKLFWTLSGVFLAMLIFAVGVWVYAFLPKAVVTVIPRTAEQSGDVSAEMSESDGAVFIDEEREFEQVFSSTGTSEGGNAKASGTVTIYNTYSEEAQPLVATTRFVTSDGKLFRTVRTVTVPGVTKNGDEITPGSIDVEVRADEPGSEYNIPPSEFTIPGFKGSPKYEAFSAKSEDAMVGGASGSEELTVVSEEDVEKARKEIKNTIRQALEQESGTEKNPMVLSEDTLEVEILEEKVSPSVGTAADTFTYTITAKVRAALFPENALKECAWNEMDNGLPDSGSVDWQHDAISLDYGKITADFEDKKIDIRLVADAVFRSGINTEAIRRDLLGKDISQMQEILDAHPELESADARLEYSYLSQKIPSRESRVEVNVE